MARFEQSRVAKRGRAFALVAAVALVGACGDDSGDNGSEDGGTHSDAGKNDAGRDAATDASMDAGRDVGDAGADAAKDAGTADAGPLAVPGNDAPTLTKIGFYNGLYAGTQTPDAFGPRILIAGTDKNGDVASYTISFFSDTMGKTPVAVSTTGDSTAPGSVTATGTFVPDGVHADFVIEVVPSQEVITDVKSITVTVTDKMGNSNSNTLAAVALGSAPNASGSCDALYGFNICSATSVCAPSGTSYTCQGVTSAREAACSSNSVLTINAPGSVTGTLNNASFWDAPVGCVGGDMPTGLFDRVVKVHVANGPVTLTLASGDNPTFDVGIYELPTNTPACAVNQTTACDSPCATCADTQFSPLVLPNLATGDYYFVVERFPTEKNGNTFTINATVQ